MSIVYRLKSPLAAQLELTNACNYACLHCYNYWRYLENGEKIEKVDFSLGISHFEAILEKLIIAGIPSITFTGGEPFTRRDILFSLIKQAKNGNMKVRINTNGSLINQNDVIKMEECGVDFILISFPSCDPIEFKKIINSNNYNATLKAITYLKDSSIGTQINMVVSQININNVRNTGLLLKDYGIKTFCATPVVACPSVDGHRELSLSPNQIKKVLDDLLYLEDCGMHVDVLEPLTHCMFNEEERKKYKQFLSFRGCSAGISDVVISATGDIRACILSNQVEGNIFTDGWENGWAKLEKWGNDTLLPDSCMSCSLVDFCGGGCRVAALAKTNKINGHDPYMCKPVTKIDSHLIDKLKKNQPDFEIDKEIMFNPSFTTRTEDFGGVIFCDNSNYLFLNQGSFDFICALSKEKETSFTVDEVCDRFKLEKTDVIDFFKPLLVNDFLRLVRY